VILFRPEAARELAADVRYYDERYTGRGQRFAVSVERTLGLITEFPLAFPVLYDPDIRSAKVARFPYRIVYVVVGSNIDVIAVAHAKRRPTYWRDRIG
jgi:plasmid stabilization system protein ParE